MRPLLLTLFPLYLERPRSYEAAPLLDDVELPFIQTGQKYTWRRKLRPVTQAESHSL